MSIKKEDSLCLHCLLPILPGERHFACFNNPQIIAKDQCIICLKDEGLGDHTECRKKMVIFRQQLINLFKG